MTTVAKRPQISTQEYYSHFKEYNLLNAADEREMLILIKNSDPDGQWRAKFTQHNMRLVLHCVIKFCPIDDPRSADLVSAGTIGLIKAIDDFDLSLPNRFSTYAVWWIKALIRKELYKLNPPVFRFKSLQTAYRSARRELIEDGVFEPTQAMIFELLDWDEKKRQRYLDDIERRTISIDQLDTTGSDDSVEALGLEEDDSVNAIPILMKEEAADRLNEALGKLSPELEDIIRRHFALGYQKSETYDALASYYGYTRERIRQLENDGLRKLWFLLRDLR